MFASRVDPGPRPALDKAIELDPGYVEAYVSRCHLRRQTHQFDGALADCDRAIELEPTLAPAYVDRGNLYDDRGDFELALADYDKAIELDPKAAGAYRNRGAAYHFQGDLEHALADYDMAIELDPEGPLLAGAAGLVFGLLLVILAGLRLINLTTRRAFLALLLGLVGGPIAYLVLFVVAGFGAGVLPVSILAVLTFLLPVASGIGVVSVAAFPSLIRGGFRSAGGGPATPEDGDWSRPTNDPYRP